MKNTSWLLFIFFLLAQLALPTLAETMIDRQAEEKLDSPSAAPLPKENIPLWKKLWENPRVKKALKIGGCTTAIATLYLVTTTCFLLYKKAPISKAVFIKANPHVQVDTLLLFKSYLMAIGIGQTQLLGAYLGVFGVKEAWAAAFFRNVASALVSGNEPYFGLSIGLCRGIRCIENVQERANFWKFFNVYLEANIGAYLNPTEGIAANYKKVGCILF